MGIQKGRDPFGHFFRNRFFLWKHMLEVQYRKNNFDGMFKIQGRKDEVFEFCPIKMADPPNPYSKTKNTHGGHLIIAMFICEPIFVSFGVHLYEYDVTLGFCRELWRCRIYVTLRLTRYEKLYNRYSIYSVQVNDSNNQ